MTWPPQYPDGAPVRPSDVVLWRGRKYHVLSIWNDDADRTNVTLRQWAPHRPLIRVRSADLTPAKED